MYRIGIDVGGTFTDLVAVDPSGRATLAKVASTPRVIKTKEVGIPIRPGDVFLVHSGGGGGWGDPKKRTREARAHDVELGFVSAPSATSAAGAKPELVTAKRKRA